MEKLEFVFIVLVVKRTFQPRLSLFDQFGRSFNCACTICSITLLLHRRSILRFGGWHFISRHTSRKCVPLSLLAGGIRGFKGLRSQKLDTFTSGDGAPPFLAVGTDAGMDERR